MINASLAFRKKINDGATDYIEYAKITLADGTELTIDRDNIWSGGFSIDDAVSSDSDFQVGAAIINKGTLIINNYYGEYSDYDFTNAKVAMWLGFQIGPNNQEKYVKGTFNVDDATYNGVLIELECLDNMAKFDKPYSQSGLSYPASVDAIIRNACTDCGVQLANGAGLPIPHQFFLIEKKPESETATYRDVISWVAQICGCYAKCNREGKLELNWYKQSAIEKVMDSLSGGSFVPWTAGDGVSGGSFSPWTAGEGYSGGGFNEYDGIHFISHTFSHNVSVDDVVITGVRALVKREEPSQSGEEMAEFFTGTTGYIIEIADNPLITVNNATEIVNWLGLELIGFTFRKATVSHLLNPLIEAGDVAILSDTKGNYYPIVISRTTLTMGETQQTVSAAQTPARNSAPKYSAETRNYVELRKFIKRDRTAWEAAEENLIERIENADGLFETTVQSASGDIHYLHNRPDLAESDIRIMISTVGVTMTANGTDAEPTWYGLTVNGDLIASILSTNGIVADWITSGTLTLGGPGTGAGILRVVDSNGSEIGKWDRDGIQVNKGNVSGTTFVAAGSDGSEIKIDSYGLSGEHTNRENGDYTYYLGYYDQSSMRWKDIPFLMFNDTASDIIRKNAQISYDGVILRGFVKDASDHWAEQTNTQIAPGYLQIGTPGCFVVDDSPSVLSHDPLVTIRADVEVGLSGKKLTFASAGEILLPYGGKVTASGNGSKITAAEIVATQTKNRLFATQNYGDRLLYSYETPSPMFGDVGEGVIGDDGYCHVQIDPVFAETISTSQYQVFVQKYSDGDCFVSRRDPSCFVIAGTPGLSFGWELKSKQRDFDQRRLDTPDYLETEKTTFDYGEEAINHMRCIYAERGVA